MLSRRRPTILSGAMLGVALALSACGADAPREAGAARAVAVEGDPRAAATRAATVAEDRQVLAERRVGVLAPDRAPAGTRASARLVVRSLAARGRVVTLRAAVILDRWDSRQSSLGGQPTLFELDPGMPQDRGEAELLDVDHLRRHLPLTDADGEVLRSRRLATGSPGGTPIELSWQFAAPPASVERMDVQIGHWPVFREIPVTRR
ncbi:hypothetical protein SK069_02060 [Patulibacter brassicae]|uniref:DUF3261 domain-containing protein n=1 Tax=Patulibacter brassicae TaxID=1705717 RepID=A0ABU4VEX0_9ACTN|nr:hypothetical protein [Patulibacter brassicae]MDX8150366.1 hypothetical protein [Patulibacter brassicae]